MGEQRQRAIAAQKKQRARGCVRECGEFVVEAVELEIVVRMGYQRADGVRAGNRERDTVGERGHLDHDMAARWALQARSVRLSKS
jgi:hypothetical protein